MQLVNRIFNPILRLKKVDIKGELPPVKDLYKKTIKYAWPCILEAVSGALISAIDMAMVGSIGKTAISAVGICSQPTLLCLVPINAIVTAAVVLIARRKGENKQESANDYLKVALILGLAFSLLFCGLFYIFSKETLLFAGANSEYLDIANEYFRIRLFSLTLCSLAAIMSGAQRGVGNTKISMISNLSANLVNILFNALLINGLLGFPKLGVRGAAIATAIGYWVAFIIALISVLRKDRYLVLNFKKIPHFLYKCKKIFSIFNSVFIEQFITRFGFFAYAIIVAKLGTAEFAAHQICINIVSINFALANGLQASNTALVGQSLGANRSDLAIIHSSITQNIGLLFAFINAILLIFFPREICMIYTNDIDVISLTNIPMKIMCVVVFCQAMQTITIAALRGAGDVKFVTFMMLICVGIIRPGLSYVFVYILNMGLIGAWLGLLVDQFSRFLYSYIRFKRGKWVNIKV